MRILKAYHTDGSIRAVWQDSMDSSLRASGLVPRRASRVEVITEGPNMDLFHVDFSPLAEITKQSKYAVCLTKTFGTHTEAVQAEVAWLEKNWVIHSREVNNNGENAR